MFRQDSAGGTKLKKLKTIIYGIGVVIMFGLAAYSLYLNRPAAAGVAAAFMLALILVQQLPILESFEILSLKAKFRAQLDEATELLAHLRDGARASARSTYLQIAYMNRMGSIGWRRKRQILEDNDRQLRKLEVPEDEILELKRPFLNLLTFDLGRIFERAAKERVQQYRTAADKIYQERHGARAMRADDAAYRSFTAWQRSLCPPESKLSDPLGRIDFDRPRALLEPWLAALPIPAADHDRLAEIMNEVIDLIEACWRAGTVTNEAEAYLKKYGPDDREVDRLVALGLPAAQLTPPSEIA